MQTFIVNTDLSSVSESFPAMALVSYGEQILERYNNSLDVGNVYLKTTEDLGTSGGYEACLTLIGN
jgi:hypothetical protein